MPVGTSRRATEYHTASFYAFLKRKDHDKRLDTDQPIVSPSPARMARTQEEMQDQLFRDSHAIISEIYLASYSLPCFRGKLWYKRKCTKWIER